MTSKEEQAADALQAGAGHSIHIRVHREETKGGRRKLHIVNFTICVTDQIPGHAEAQLVVTLRYKPEGSRFDSPQCY
jgi:hypothetical protein